MMGRLERDQEQLFYSFCLEEAVPDDHQVRAIATALDLSWVYGELSPHYPALGRPSVDPVLMIRMHHIIVLGEVHLRQILQSYARYYNDIRTRRSLDKDAPVSRQIQRIGSIKSHAILGGLHHHYARA